MIFLVVLAVSCSGQSAPAPPPEFHDRSAVGHERAVAVAGTAPTPRRALA